MLSRKTKELNESGFTLVEIIVVLVIIAMLASISIPTLVGFVDDAKGKAHIMEARTVYVAAQSAITQELALGRVPSLEILGSQNSSKKSESVEECISSLLKGSMPSVYEYQVLLDKENYEILVLEYIVDGFQITLDTKSDNGVTVKKIKK